VLVLDIEGHAAAARLFRRLRSKGVTVRGAIDCIIDHACIAAGVELLSTNQDFAAIARHSTLRLCAV
jgi:predicted nucleic acid-binding protein